jgi:hypothetical protein
MLKIPPAPFRKGGEEVFWDRLIICCEKGARHQPFVSQHLFLISFSSPTIPWPPFSDYCPLAYYCPLLYCPLTTTTAHCSTAP